MANWKLKMTVGTVLFVGGGYIFMSGVKEAPETVHDNVVVIINMLAEGAGKYVKKLNW